MATTTKTNENPWLTPGFDSLGRADNEPTGTRPVQPRPQNVDKGQYGDEDWPTGKPFSAKKIKAKEFKK